MAGTGPGRGQLRPRRTPRAGTRAWPPASTPSPPAGPNCWGSPGASPRGGPGWAQAIQPGACREPPSPSTIEALVRVALLRDCPPRPSYVGRTRRDSQRRLQVGTFCRNCFRLLPASCLLGRAAPLSAQGKSRLMPCEPAPRGLPLPPGPEAARTFRQSASARLTSVPSCAHTCDVSDSLPVDLGHRRQGGAVPRGTDGTQSPPLVARRAQGLQGHWEPPPHPQAAERGSV